MVDRRARRAYYRGNTPKDLTYAHGHFTMVNGTSPWIPVSGVLAQGNSSEFLHIVKG